MNTSFLARNILSDMWEYGRLVLIAAVGAAIWGSLLKKSERQEDQSFYQSGILLIVLGLVGSFVLFSFVNVQFANIVALMWAKPGWGIFTGLVGFSWLVFTGVSVFKLFTTFRREPVISIREISDGVPHEISTSRGKVIVSILALLMVTSVVWLWRMSK